MTPTSSEARENFPVFSPDGTTIAFSSNQDGERDRFGNLTFDNYLLSVAADDTPGAVQRISDHPGQDSHPWFSPDGEWLVYASERAGINEGQSVLVAAGERQETWHRPRLYVRFRGEQSGATFVARRLGSVPGCRRHDT